MAEANDSIMAGGYSSSVRKTLPMSASGLPISGSNPFPVISSSMDVFANLIQIPITFVAGLTGAVGTFKLLTVTGVVGLSIFGVCSVNVTGTGTIEVGTAAATAALIAQTAGSNILANEIYHDATPDSSVELTSVITKKIVTSNVNYKITTNTLTAGQITFYASWYPISSGATVTL